MFFPGTPSIFVPGDSVFMLLRCMCNNILLEKKTKTQGVMVQSQDIHLE